MLCRRCSCVLAARPQDALPCSYVSWLWTPLFPHPTSSSLFPCNNNTIFTVNRLKLSLRLGLPLASFHSVSHNTRGASTHASLHSRVQADRPPQSDEVTATVAACAGRAACAPRSCQGGRQVQRRDAVRRRGAVLRPWWNVWLGRRGLVSRPPFLCS